jgi:hypothetical protein
MTRDEILVMKPGRELDALVARGWADGMIGIVYEYRCREHGAKNPYVIFRNLRYLHLCPECNREMQKTYVDVRIFGDSLEHSGRSLTERGQDKL